MTVTSVSRVEHGQLHACVSQTDNIEFGGYRMNARALVMQTRQRLRGVKACNGVELLLPEATECSKVVCFGCFRPKCGMLCVFFHSFACSSSLVAFVAKWMAGTRQR